MWILILVAVLLVVLALVMYFMRRKLRPMDISMALGGAVGALAGIALVELWGYEYPVPFILWMLGMAAGQLVAWFSTRNR